MATVIPGKKELAWYKRKGFTEAVGGIAALLSTCLASYQLYLDPAKRDFSYWTLGIFSVAAFAFGLKVIQGNAQDRKEIDGGDHDGIQGAIYVVHATACHACGLAPSEGAKTIRATFHRLIYNDAKKAADPTEYEQVMDYVGRSGGGKGRVFSVSIGISGMAIRTGDAWAAERKNTDIAKYQKELIEDWGYTAAATREVSTEPMSWLAVPLRDSDTDKVIGLVYLDSTVAKAFETEAVKTAILTACLGVTKYVEKRYKS